MKIKSKEIKDLERCPYQQNRYCIKAGKGDPCGGSIKNCNERDKIYFKLKEIENFKDLSENLEKKLYLKEYLNLK